MSDGINNSYHDIDYWEGYYGDWWWGWTTYSTSSTCIVPQSGQIKLNLSNILGRTSWQLLNLTQHETGHGIGLSHVCSCPHQMDPCQNCGSCTLTNCDGQGAASLYP